MSTRINLTDDVREQGIQLAKQGQSETVILNKLDIDIDKFNEKCDKGNKDFLSFRKKIYASALEFWENIGAENIGTRGFNSSAYNFIMKNRFSKNYSDGKKEEKVKTDDRPINIIIDNKKFKKTPITSEKELRQREQKLLKGLFDE
jgi:hypothetical protein